MQTEDDNVNQLFNIDYIDDIDNIDFMDLIIIIKNINNHTVLKLLYNRHYNLKIESILLLKLLNYNDLFSICCSDNPFSFIRNDKTITNIINELKEIYISIYMESIKYKCFRNMPNNNFIVIIKNHYFKFNIEVLSVKLKQLINVLEYIYNFHKGYYDKEKEFSKIRCNNIQEHMFYQEQFEDFVKEYRKNNKITSIVNLTNSESIGNIDDILKYLFIE